MLPLAKILTKSAPSSLIHLSIEQANLIRRTGVVEDLVDRRQDARARHAAVVDPVADVLVHSDCPGFESS